jgi:hypothetical protein
MALSKESEEAPEIRYNLCVERIKKRYEELARRIDFMYRTSTGRDGEKLKLLPLRLEETAKALLIVILKDLKLKG